MRYSILGFNQEALVNIGNGELKLDMQDVVLMDYIQRALSQPSMNKIMQEKQPYVWLNHSKILEDLPILNIKESMLGKHLLKLAQLNLIKSITLANEYNRGTRTYYTITEKFEELQYTTTRNKFEEVTRPPVINSTCSSRPPVINSGSYNKLLNDNKLKNTLSKDKVGCFSFGGTKTITTEITSNEIQTFLDLYNEHCFNLSKVKKLTDKRAKAIKHIIGKYTQEEILQVFDNTNNSSFLTGNNDRGWKADIDFILREDKFVNILEGKYGGKGKRSNKGGFVDEAVYKPVTKEEMEEMKKFQEELKANGKQVIF